MNKKKITAYIAFCLLLFSLCSCLQDATNLYGTIPTIYEQEMKGVTEAAQKRTTDRGELLNLMMEMADSAFNVAHKKAEGQTEDLVGKYVNTSIDSDVDLEIPSGIKITEVKLPDLTQENGGTPVTTISFEAKTNDNMLYYLIEGKYGVIDGGSVGTAGKDDKNVVHIDMDIMAPNVPAKYQEDCKTIHFVSFKTFCDVENTIPEKQNKWRKEYSKKMKL